MAMQEVGSVVVQVREDASSQTALRRKIAFLSALGLLDFTIMSLYQLGVIRKLPDVPLSWVDSEKVISSKDAAIFGVPDAAIALNAYAANFLLSAASSAKKKHSRWLDLLLAGVVAGNAVGAAYFMLNMVFVQKKVCMYCVTGAIINFVSIKPMLALLRK